MRPKPGTRQGGQRPTAVSSPLFPVPELSRTQTRSILCPPRACLQVAERGSWGRARRPRPPTTTTTPLVPGSFAVMNDFPQPLSWELRG